MTKSTLGILALFATGAIVSSGSPLWWPFAMIGSASFLAGVNDLLGQEPFANRLRRPRAWVTLWILYSAAGGAVEAVRMLPDLWQYAAPYEHPAALTALILLGYPVMFVIAVEAHALTSRWLGRGLAALGTLAIVVLVNEVPQALAPMWRVPAERSDFVHWLFALGYIAEVGVALTAFEWLARNRRDEQRSGHGGQKARKVQTLDASTEDGSETRRSGP